MKSIIIDLWKNKRLIFNLAKNDFKTKYAGSYLGIFWAFVQPIVTILVYWFVFQVGFRSGTVSEFPFVVWLTCGMVPWFFFSDAWMSATNSMLEYSYLVKKVVFNIGILPMVKILSAFFVNLFFILVMLVLCAVYGYYPNLYSLQFIYYIFAMFMLVLSLSYLTSAIVIFFRDLTQLMNIVLQVGMWMTPIMWNKAMLDESLWWILKLNPMFYIVQGYRDSILEQTWFFEHMTWTIYFWVFIIVAFIIGTAIFKKLRPHFADVL